MMIRQSICILSIITKGMGKLKTHSPTYCIMDNWENMLKLTHTLDKLYMTGILYVFQDSTFGNAFFKMVAILRGVRWLTPGWIRHKKYLTVITFTYLTAYMNIQYIPRNIHTVFALLCFVVVIHWLIFPYPSGLLHWHCGNLTIAPVPANKPWWIWINTSCEFIMNDWVTTTKQSTTKPCAYFLGYTVHRGNNSWNIHLIFCRALFESVKLLQK